MRARLLVLGASALVFAIIIASVQAATFSPAGSPYNGGDGVASCPPAGGLPAPSSPPTVNAVTCTETNGPSPVTVTWVSDTPSGSQTDNAWGQGTQSDCYLAKAGGNAAACVSAVTGIGASKTDLQDFGLGLARNSSNGHLYLYDGFRRILTSSTSSSNANLNFEFNQLLPAFQPAAPVCLPNLTFTGGCNRWRSPGDLMISYDFGGNASACNTPTPDICSFTWIVTNNATDGACFSAKAAPCWGHAQSLFSNNLAFGSISSDQTFGEAVTDITAAGLVGSGCETFRQSWAQSRSSSSFTAEMKDLIVANVTITTCVQPTVTTTLSTSNPINVGGTINDSATVANTLAGSSPVSGDQVTFRVYSDSACTTPATTSQITNPVQVANVTSFASVGPVTFTAGSGAAAAGRYYVQAVFTPGATDTSNQASDPSACTDEIFTVLTPSSVATTLSATAPVLAGTAIHDSATLSNFKPGAGGQVTYSVYGDSSCSTLVSSGGTKTVTNGVVPDSSSVTLNTPGTYYWQAVYSGDTPNSTPAGTGFTIGSTSPCTSEIEVVEIQSSIVTTLSATAPVLAGTAVHDSATLSSFATGAGGQATYTVYSDAACTNAVASGGTKTVTNGVVPDSSAVTLNTPGKYYWQVVYSGDTPTSTPAGTGFTRGSTSACGSEIEVVEIQSSVATTLSATAPVLVGTAVHDSATLSSFATGAGGQATYTVYSDAACTNAVASGGTKTVTNGIVPDSNAVTLNTPGKYYWQVVYSGDTPASTPAGTGFTRGATSACGSEIEVVEVQSSIVTLLSSGNGGSVISGSAVHDSATLSSFATGAGGQVTYTVYSDSVCTNAVASGGTKTVTNGIAPDSNDVTLTTTGTYYWQVAYSGDTPSSTPAGTGLTRGSSSSCTSEVEVVINPATSISIFDRITGLPTSGTQSTGTVNYYVYDSAVDCAAGGATGLLADVTPANNSYAGGNNGAGPASNVYTSSGSTGPLFIRATYTVTGAASPIFVSCKENFTIVE